MENPNHHFSPHVDTSSETHEAGHVEASVPTTADTRDRVFEVLTAHDAKLRNLAHYLHDEIGQLMVSSSMHLHASLDSEPVSPRLTTCLAIIQQAVERLRGLTSQLHPSILEHLPLPEALRCSLDDRGRRDHVAIEFFAPDFWIPLPPTTAITCYYAVMQAVEHAISQRYADRIHVILRQDAEAVDFTIRDICTSPSSKSFPSNRDRFGCDEWKEICKRIDWLKGIWQIESTPGQGETVHIRLPLAVDLATVSESDVL